MLVDLTVVLGFLGFVVGGDQLRLFLTALKKMFKGVFVLFQEVHEQAVHKPQRHAIVAEEGSFLQCHDEVGLLLKIDVPD